MPNLANERDVLEFCRKRREEMERAWRRDGRWEPNGYSFSGWVFASHTPSLGPHPRDPASWRPGAKLDRVKALECKLPPIVRQLVPSRSRNGSYTDRFEFVLRHYARACAALGVLILGEAWSKQYTFAQAHTEGREPTKEEFQKARDQDPDDLANAEGRTESLFCSLEHRAVGRRWWWAEIQRNPDRLLPWRMQDLGPPNDDRLRGFVDIPAN